MTAQDWKYLQQDLEQVENGTSSFEPEDEKEPGEEWEEEEEEPEESQEKLFDVTAGCKNNQDWYDYELNVAESRVENVKAAIQKNHENSCGCGGEPDISVDDAVSIDEE
jgi:hypothetical protein